MDENDSTDPKLEAAWIRKGSPWSRAFYRMLGMTSAREDRERDN